MENKCEGHRKRLRERFLQSGLDGFLDYEVVELLLTLGTPRRDCKQPAKEALNKFKNLISVLDAKTEDLQKIKGVGPSNVFGIKLFKAISERYSKEKIESKVLLNSPEKIFEYLKEKIGKEKKEYLAKIKEKKGWINYSPSFLRPNMKTRPIKAATGRATVGNSGIDTLTVSAE